MKIYNSLRNPLKMILIATCTLCLSSCKDDCLLCTPCETNNTAEVTFSNFSSNRTYRVVWNNTSVAVLNPGQSTGPHTYAARTHEYVFIDESTGNNACNPASPSLAQCESYQFSCN